MNKIITIFTPTYNRGYIIENLYKSLKDQSCKSFEWIVVDDGSKDNTEELFNKWINEENDFTIKYIKQTNGGKHRAINKGIDLAKGFMFFIVDSDDIITEDAIEKIFEWEESIKEKSKFAGVSGNRGYSQNTVIGETFEGNYIDATSLEREKYNIFGDKAEVFYTDILKKFKFPEYNGENFLTENIVWYKIASEGYKIRWFNEIIYVGNYLEDGLTKSGNEIFIRNPLGYAESIKTKIRYCCPKLKQKTSMYYNYYEDLKNNLDFKSIYRNLNLNFFEMLIIIFLGNIYDKLKGKK